MRILVAILAAGESRRMGQPKLCLPWEGTTILGHILAQWRQAGAKHLLVVHAPGETPVTRELDRLGVPPHERTATLAMERGMMGSVVTAAGRAMADPSLTHLVIALGDQPQVRVETLRAMLKTCENATGKLVQAIFNDKSGHPLALPSHLLEELLTTPCATLRDFLSLKETPAQSLTCDDSGVLLDLDTPDDYARAAQEWNPPLT